LTREQSILKIFENRTMKVQNSRMLYQFDYDEVVRIFAEVPCVIPFSTSEVEASPSLCSLGLSLVDPLGVSVNILDENQPQYRHVIWSYGTWSPAKIQHIVGGRLNVISHVGIRSRDQTTCHTTSEVSNRDSLRDVNTASSSVFLVLKFSQWSFHRIWASSRRVADMWYEKVRFHDSRPALNVFPKVNNI
jgi:hypothetical protein